MVAMDVNLNASKDRKPVIVVQAPPPTGSDPFIPTTRDQASSTRGCLRCLLIIILVLGFSVFSLFVFATRGFCAGRHHRYNLTVQSIKEAEQPIYQVSWTHIQNYISISYFFEDSEVPQEKSFLLATHERVTWFQALVACQTYNMSLASISSAEEQDQLIAQIILAEDLGEMDFWTSGSDLASAGEWVWMTGGQPVSYTNWMRFHNTLRNDEQHCLNLAFHSDYAWEQSYCNSYKYYICQY